MHIALDFTVASGRFKFQKPEIREKMFIILNDDMKIIKKILI
jgi:hypothetical protein